MIRPGLNLRAEVDMATELSGRARQMLDQHRVARLATVDANGAPTLVPVCFVFDGNACYLPIDEKPKRSAPERLKRVRNIEKNPKVALLFDEYFEDWSRLAWVQVHGRAAILSGDGIDAAEHARAVAALCAKYPQYRTMKLATRPMIRLTVERVSTWFAVEEAGDQ